MFNNKIITIRAWVYKTGFYIIILHFIFVKKLILCNTIHDFSVWLRTSYDPVDINRFRSHTGKYNFVFL